MSYCPKCGNKVDDTMTFCSNCGTRLKDSTSSQAQPIESDQRQEKTEKNKEQETRTPPEKAGKPEKAERGFVYYLAGGLILITISVFAILELTKPALMTGQNLAFVFVIIGLIVIFAAVYAATSGRKSVSSKPLDKPDVKQPKSQCPTP